MSSPVRTAQIQLLRLMALAFCALLLWNVYRLLSFAWIGIPFPYQFDYGEGIVWQQMRDMVRGTAYGPLHAFPAVVYHYPPVYHLISAALAGLTGMDELAAGRTVSLVSTLLTAVLAGLLTTGAIARGVDGKVRILCGALAGLFFLNCYPVMMWATMMRVDMLSGCLGLLGLLWSARAIERPGLIYPASVAFVLSVFTKQISIAAPMAAFAVLLVTHPKLALRGLGTCFALGILGLAVPAWLTGGDFLRHIFLYNINRFDPSVLGEALIPLIFHIAFLVLAAFGAADAWRAVGPRLRSPDAFQAMRARWAQDHGSALLAMLLLFLIVKTLMLAGMMKSGANYNYLIEWFSAVAIFAALALQRTVTAAAGGGETGVSAYRPLMLLALAGLIAQTWFLPFRQDTPEILALREGLRARIVARIAQSPKPVISDEMTLLIRAGQDVRWEPAIAAELAHTKLYDQAAFVRMIEAHRFGFFVTEGDKGDRIFDSRYNPPVAAAMKAAYPREERLGRFVLHLPD